MDGVGQGIGNWRERVARHEQEKQKLVFVQIQKETK